MTPAVSILLPVRDAQATLHACIESIEGQTLKDWECLAVDDRSQDGTREILNAWARRDRRVRVADAPDPGGIVAALETARRLARAPILARQDADDRSLPQRLERQVAHLDSAGGGIAVLGCRIVPAGPLPSDGMRRYLAWLDACASPAEGEGSLAWSAEACAREIWIESPIAHPTAVLRADALAAVGGYREMGWPEDYDLWLRIHRAGLRIACAEDRLYEWTDHLGRLSRVDPRYSARAFLACRAHHLRRWLAERGFGPARPLIIWGAGRDGRRLAKAWEEEIRSPGRPAPTVAAFVDIDPRKIGRSRRGRPVLEFSRSRDAFPAAFYLAAVGVEGARDRIRERMRSEELEEGRDFVCVQ